MWMLWNEKQIKYSPKVVYQYRITRGMKAFLSISGIALTVAWFPDIVTSLVNGISLDLIEVYTTEITYVLDMGILSLLMFLYLLNRESFMGYVLFRMILKICAGIGIMIISQSVFQIMEEVSVPNPALLALTAVIFEKRLKRETRYIEIELSRFCLLLYYIIYLNLTNTIYKNIYKAIIYMII